LGNIAGGIMRRHGNGILLNVNCNWVLRFLAAVLVCQHLFIFPPLFLNFSVVGLVLLEPVGVVWLIRNTRTWSHAPHCREGGFPGGWSGGPAEGLISDIRFNSGWLEISNLNHTSSEMNASTKGMGNKVRLKHCQR